MQYALPFSAKQLARRRGAYGIDAPYVPFGLGLLGIAAMILSAIFTWAFHWAVLGIICLIYGLYMLLSASSYLYTTRRGKFQVWSELLTQLALRGDEYILDMGCGRGAVLLMAASLLTTGKATGIDLWNQHDQSGNAYEVTRHNAELEGVSQRVELETADMSKLPFADGSFDVLLSSLAIHNIPDPAGRKQAIDEAARVLKPGGKLLIADMRATRQYAARLRELGMADVSCRMLDWRFWYGSPWFATWQVSASKPV